MNLSWKDLLCIAIVVAGVVWFLRPRQRKAGCGCGPKPAASTTNAAAPKKAACSGGVALCGGR